MQCECIHASPSWHKGALKFDMIFVEIDPNMPGMLGIDIALKFTSFSPSSIMALTILALVDWFSHVGDQPDDDTGMWVIEQDYDIDHCQLSEVIHIDSIIRCLHLIGVYGPELVSTDIKFSDSLYTFPTHYVNKYADHHSLNS